MKHATIKSNREVVAANCSANISFISEGGPFLLRDIVIPKEVGKKFLVTDIKVGRNSQLASQGAIPACFFSDVEGVERVEGLLFDNAPRGFEIVLSVTNITASTAEFEAELRGEVSEETGLKDLRRGTKVLMGLGFTPVLENNGLVVRVQTHMVGRPVLLYVPDQVLDNFEVKDVRSVGASVASPSSLKSSRAKLEATVMRVSDWFVVEAGKKSGDPRAFSGCVVLEMKS